MWAKADRCGRVLWLGAEEVSVRWLVLNKCQSDSRPRLEGVLLKYPTSCSVLLKPSFTEHVTHTPTNSPPLPGLAHWTNIKVSALGSTEGWTPTCYNERTPISMAWTSSSAITRGRGNATGIIQSPISLFSRMDREWVRRAFVRQAQTVFGKFLGAGDAAYRSRRGWWDCTARAKSDINDCLMIYPSWW